MTPERKSPGGLTSVVMGILFVGIGLGALAWLITSLGEPVIGARGGAFYVLFVIFCLVLVPTGLALGILSIFHGFRKLGAR